MIEEPPPAEPDYSWLDPRAIPDLKDLYPHTMLNLALDTSFGLLPMVMRAPLERAFFTNLSRLIDKAIYEYERGRLARRDLEEHAKEGRISPLWGATNHFENCIDALHRASLYVDHLRRHRDVPEIRKAELLTRKEIARLRRMRNSIQHLDEHMARGRWKGKEHFMTLQVDFLELDGNQITYEELSRWIRLLYALCERLRTTAVPPDSPQM